ncbi:hypothetical protein CLV98_104440 [Dyadobacter jejuensis]|uniref:Uncharacterized protein n=1 Tax=Dyadobacter jejuensis TaxID=1082580 RepID=A0A316AP49_9BACT|nr:hypothetical protein [Dyadobacter jejuensis]PWJ58580.1 hypothetical protein CLV98_104440 [Dyadobacter jejuensis]
MFNRERNAKMKWYDGFLKKLDTPLWVRLVLLYYMGISPGFAGNDLLLTHVFINPVDSLEKITITESQSENGLSNWFSQDVNRAVCTSEQCKMVNIRLFWDGVGNYQRFELIDNEPLTKTDHTSFDSEDYAKLNGILADANSIFRELGMEDLVVETDETIDGKTGATQKSLSEYVVSEAVYTCYTLWHIVYGPTQSRIKALIAERASEAYLRLALTNEDSIYPIWALGYVADHPGNSVPFFDRLLTQLTSSNETVASLAMEAIHPQALSKEGSQLAFVNQIPQLDDLKKLDMLWKLAEAETVYDQVLIQLLGYYQAGQLNATALGYVYKLFSAPNMANPIVYKNLERLLSDPNRYVANTTKKLLEKWTVD